MQAKLLHLPRTRTSTVGRPLADLAGLLTSWLRNRAERISLARLDDRTLKDVGLTRADVDHEYERPFWEPVDHAALEWVRRRCGPRLGR
jgi:uncharacterized protein YjiS (DUF1127 family)